MGSPEVASGGDLDGDGIDELVFGEPILLPTPEGDPDAPACLEQALCIGKVMVVRGLP